MFSRLFYTPPKLTEMAYLESLCNDDLDEQALVCEYRDYYDGDHRTELTERQQAFLDSVAGQKFRLNQCPNVVEALVDRLEVTGFEVIAQEEESEEIPDPPAESDEAEAQPGAGLADFAAMLWEENRMDAGQEEIFRQAAIDYVTYVVLDIDEAGRITFNHNDRYTAPTATGSGTGEGVKLHYATANRRWGPIFATKRWAVQSGDGAGYRRYFTVYYPDRIERYYQDDREQSGSKERGESGWLRLVEKEGPLAGVWPQPWIDQAGQPLGIPVVEFRNGRASELSEVTPIQRALNKSFIDLIAAADAAGFSIYFAAGWTPTSDGNPIVLDAGGNVVSSNAALKLSPGAIVYTTNKDGRMEVLPGDDLTRLIQVIDRHILSIAQVSRTPVSNFQMFGQIPSADSQKQLETGLLAKCKSRHRVYGNAWEDLIYLARRVAMGAPKYGTTSAAGRIVGTGEVAGFGLPAYTAMLQGTEGVKIGTLWKDAQTRNERDHLETLRIKKELGVPQGQIYLEMGYSQQQAERWEAAAEERRLAMASLFEGGNDDGGEGETGRQGAVPAAGPGGVANNGNGRSASAG